MNKLFLLLLLVSTISFGQIKINPIYVGYPDKEVTDLMVRVMPFETNSLSCDLYYELRNSEGTMLANGNLHVTESEFSAWGQSNKYIEDLALVKLNLTRKED